MKMSSLDFIGSLGKGVRCLCGVGSLCVSVFVPLSLSRSNDKAKVGGARGACAPP